MIHPTAVIHPKAQVEPSVIVGPYAVIDEAVTVNAVERPPEPLPDQSWMLSRL